MKKGIIYVMSTAVVGLIKIGKTATENYNQRMTNLENNGYRNVTGLKREFAIEVSDYEAKELLLDSLFSRSRVANTELFSLNLNEVIQLLSSFEGKVVFPEQETKTQIFENALDAVQAGLVPNGTYTLKIKNRGGSGYVEATMDVSDGKFIVGSGAYVGSWEIVRRGLKNGVTQESFEASSPSMAAAIILGHNANGWRSWKDSNGKYIDNYRLDS